MMIGGPLSLVIGYFLGGWLNELVGWRATFILLGLPGIAMATLALLTLREPRHRSPKPARMTPNGTIIVNISSTVAPTPAHRSLIAVYATLWANKTFRHLLLCVSISYFFASGINQWQPTFLVRSYGLKTGEIGTWFAAIYGAGSFVGTYWGGEWASRFAANNERLQLKVMAAVYCSFVLISPFIYLTSNKYVAFAIMGIANLAISTTNGPLFAMIQTLVPSRMRATALALVYLFANLIGIGLGPLAAGALSDALQTHLHAESLRYALLALCPGYFFAAWHLWRARLTVIPDVQASLAAQ
jgi:predicted MFS family arabinose efflux permease